MTRRHRLTDEQALELKPRTQIYCQPDPEMVGHYVRVFPSGHRSFVVCTRARGKQVWRTVGSPPMKIANARKRALEMLHSMRESPPDSFEGVAAEWFKRHVQKKGLRSAPGIERFLRLHIVPAWRGRDFNSVTRKDIAELLDRLEDKHGARQADYALAIIRGICNWRAARDAHYLSPVVKEMARTKPTERARDRFLSDDEIRSVWSATDAMGSYGRLVKFLLLSAQRREKVVAMRWEELDGNVWTIPAQAREKTNAGVLVLPDLALAVLGDRGEGLVFPGRDGKPISGWSKHKVRLDKASGVSGWVLHDLRRTARVLLSRAGVISEHAERVLGHAIAGVEGTYNRHDFKPEKTEALRKLAGLVGLLLAPQNNVVGIRRNAR